MTSCIARKDIPAPIQKLAIRLLAARSGHDVRVFETEGYLFGWVAETKAAPVLGAVRLPAGTFSKAMG